MRENIGLFRGKRIGTDEWITGHLLKVTIAEKTAYLIFEDKFTFTLGAINALSHAAVDPDTVGECTGLKDKNGKLIFEGDIVKSKFTNKPYLVCLGEYTFINEYESEEYACGWYNVDPNENETAMGCPDVWATIIGNITDNPELLKEGADNGIQ